MNILVNGITHLLIGVNQEDLEKQFEDFLGGLEAVPDTEFSIQQVQPALLIVYTAGDPVYKTAEELKAEQPRIYEPTDSPHNQQWIEEAAEDIVKND